MELTLWSLIVVGIINLTLAASVLLRNTKSWVNRSFFFFVGALSFWCISVGMLLSKKTILWSDLTLLAGNLIGISFILFAKYFPEGKSIKLRFVLGFFIFPTTLSIILAPFRLFISGIIVKGGEIQPVIGPLYPLLMVWLIFSPLYGGILLFNKYRKNTGVIRNQLKLIFYGFICFLIPITITNVILPALGIGKLAFIGPFFTLIMVGFISYAIVRHRFLDIRLIVARSVTYLLLVTFLALVYIAFLLLLSTYFSGIPIRATNIVPSVILTFLIALSFRPLERYVNKLTDTVFYKDKYDTNTLLHTMSGILTSTLDLYELSEKIFRELFHELKVMTGAVILVTGHHHKKWSYGFRYQVDELKETDIHKLITLVENRNNREHILVFDELSESEEKKILRDHNISIVIPLVVKKDLIGIILFGGKASGEIYSVEDINLLKILTPEIAIAIRNSLSFDEIKKFNITLKEEVKKATDRLQRANKRLIELDILKDDFVSIASHELRTPMTAIKSYLWMALNKPPHPLQPEVKNYLDICYKSTERLIHLVNDMLTVSRIERNKVELHFDKNNLYDIVKAVYDELRVIASDKHIELKIIADTTDLMVEGDKDRLREVIQNLVGNALKFTPAGGKINLILSKTQDTYRVAVADTGSGIPKEELNKLFTKFGRIEYSYTQHANTPGTGLGLYISKQIATLHHGDIEVQSEVGKGSTFTIILPVTQQKGEKKPTHDTA